MAATTDEKKRPYFINVPMSRTYFSQKRPGGPKTYAFVVLEYYNDRIIMRFKQGITPENTTDSSCYLQPSKAYDFANWLEGFMARRRDAFVSGKPYDASEKLEMNTTMFRDGEEVTIGLLTCDTVNVDGVPRLRITYTQYDKNSTIEVVFASNPPAGKFETSILNQNKIDYGDIEAFEFVITFKELQNPIIPMVYRIANAASGSITRYISAVMGGGRNRNNNNNRGQSNSIPGDYDAYDGVPF